MTTPADTHRAGPFSPNFDQAGPPSLSISDYDALADLFLGESDADTGAANGADNDNDSSEDTSAHPFPASTPTPAPGQTPLAVESNHATIEAVIVGHLPVRANLWLMQYARHAADELGQTVAVLRMIGDDIAIDLLSPGAGKRTFNTVDARSLDDALALAASAAAHWIVTTDELAEHSFFADDRFDRISVLTHAARTATAAAFRTLKQALSHAQPPADQRLRVVFLGSDPEDSARASTQLRSAAQASLDADIEVTVGPEQIDATRAVPLYRGRLTDQPGSIVDLVERGQQRAADQPRAERAVRATREPETAEPETRPTSLQDSLRLCTMLEGLTDLPLACPIEPRVQIALDKDGRIHLLATGDGPDPVRALAQAGAWASLNRELILAAAQRTSEAFGDPVLHLLVEDVPANRRLLDAPIRVHLLRSVPVKGGEAVWFSAPLN